MPFSHVRTQLLDAYVCKWYYLTWQAVQVAAFLMSFQISSTKLLASIALLNSSISRGERLVSSREAAPRATAPRASSVSVELGRIVNHRRPGRREMIYRDQEPDAWQGSSSYIYKFPRRCIHHITSTRRPPTYTTLPFSRCGTTLSTRLYESRVFTRDVWLTRSFPKLDQECSPWRMTFRTSSGSVGDTTLNNYQGRDTVQYALKATLP
jgi:hypothetical protein